MIRRGKAKEEVLGFSQILFQILFLTNNLEIVGKKKSGEPKETQEDPWKSKVRGIFSSSSDKKILLPFSIWPAESK